MKNSANESTDSAPKETPWHRRIVRVLAIPKDHTNDPAGRKIGDDWLLADLGYDHNQVRYYITTNNLHGSDFLDLNLDNPKCMADWLADKINAELIPDPPEEA